MRASTRAQPPIWRGLPCPTDNRCFRLAAARSRGANGGASRVLKTAPRGGVLIHKRGLKARAAAIVASSNTCFCRRRLSHKKGERRRGGLAPSPPYLSRIGDRRYGSISILQVYTSPGLLLGSSFE